MNAKQLLALLLVGGALACSHDSLPGSPADGGLSPDLASGPTADLAMEGDGQTPPTSSPAAVTAWLQAGYYKSWHCEAAAHPPGPNGAHGQNRICSNDRLAAASALAEYPVGSASVKELYSGTNVVGYAVSLRVASGASASSWYWFENGSGGLGTPLCNGCHVQAGSGGTFTGHDHVFVRVM